MATRRRKATGEKKVFLEIWDEREHVCTNCNRHLGSEPRATYFAHIKPKSIYPSLRLDKANIRLLCFECHYAYDHQSKAHFIARQNDTDS